MTPIYKLANSLVQIIIIQQKQMIKHLTKNEYYRQKNLPIPKACQRLPIQPPVRTHLLDPLPSIALDVKKCLQNRVLQNQINLQIIQYEKVVHQLEIQNQSLRLNLGQRDQQILRRKNQKESEHRKINYLEKQIFSLQNHIQKAQYQSKANLQMATRQFDIAKNDFQIKANQFQFDISRLKTQYQQEINSVRINFQNRLDSYNTDKSQLRDVADQNIQLLRKQIQKLNNQNKRIKIQLIISQKQSIQKSKFLQEQNFILKEKLTNTKLQAELQKFKFDIQSKSKDSQIQQLNHQITRLSQLLQTQQQKSAYQKQYILKHNDECEKQWKKKFKSYQQRQENINLNIQQVTKSLNEQKQYVQVCIKKITYLQGQIAIQKRTTKQVEEQYLQKQFRNQILNAQAKQSEINLLKDTLNKKINNLEIQNGQMHNQLNQLSRLNDSLKKQVQRLKCEKINVERKQRQHQIVLENVQYERDKALLMINYLKQKIQNVSNDKQLENKKNYQKLQVEKQIYMNQLIQQSNQTIQHLLIQHKQQIMKIQDQSSQMERQRKNKQKQITSKIDEYQNKIRKLNFQLEAINQKLLNQSHMQNQQKYVYQLKIKQFQDTNSKMQEDLKINSEKLFQLQSKILSLNGQIENLNQGLKNYQERQKSLKDKLKEQDHIRITQIRKWSEKQQQYLINLKKEEQTRIQLIKTSKKYQTQVLHLKIKNQTYQQEIRAISKQRQMYITQATKLKNSLIHSQKSSNNLLNQINYNYNQIKGKLQGELKEKIQVLNQRNQSLMSQIVSIKFQNQQIQAKNIQINFQKETINIELKQKIKQIQQISQKLFQNQQNLKKLQYILTQKDVKISNSSTQLAQLQNYNKMVTQRLKIHQENIKKMKKSVIIQTDEATNQKHICKQLQAKNATLKQQFEEAQRLKTVYYQKHMQMQLNIQVLENQNYQLRQHVQIISKRQKTQAIIHQQKIEKLETNYNQSKRQLDQKLIVLEKNIGLLDKQIQNLLSRISQNASQSQKQIQKRERIIKSKSDEITYLLSQIQLVKANFDSFTKELQLKLQDKDEQIRKIEKNRMKQSSIFQDLESKNSELQVKYALLNQKFDFQVSKYQKLKQKHNQNEIKCTALEQEKQNCRTELQILKRKLQKCQYQQIQKAELYNQEIKRITLDLQNENNKLIKEERLKYQSKILQLKSRFQDEQKKNNNLKNDLNELKKNQGNIIMFYEKQIKNLQTKVDNLHRTVIYLKEFRRRWEKISGQVREYSNLDHTQPLQQNQPYYYSRNQRKSLSSFSQDRVIQQISSQNDKDKRPERRYYEYNFDYSCEIAPQNQQIRAQNLVSKNSGQNLFKKVQKQTPQTKQTKPKMNETERIAQKSYQFVSEKQLLKNNYEHVYSSQEFQDNKRTFLIEKFLQQGQSEEQKQRNKPKFTDQQLKKIRNMRYNESDGDRQYPKPLGFMTFKQQHRVTNRKLISRMVNGEQVKKFFWTAYEQEPTIKSSWISSTQWERIKQDFDCKNIQEKTGSKIKQVMSAECSNQNSKNSNSLQ